MNVNPPEWPVKLTLRDTKVHADEGQRIFTTATGYGYEKCRYIRGDVADNMLVALNAVALFVKSTPSNAAAMNAVHEAIAAAEAAQ